MFKFIRSKKAASLTGYGLAVGLIAIVAINAVSFTGDSVKSLFSSVGNSLDGVVTSGSSGGGSVTSPDLPPV